MDVEHVPLLAIQRKLYDLPRGGERFREYVATLTGGGDDIELPLTLMNPMAKDHVAPILDALLAAGAEEAAATAAAEAKERLRDVEGRAKSAIVVVDDAGGGWTNRYLTETGHRFSAKNGEVKRGWANVLVWTGGGLPTTDEIHRRTLAAVFRTHHVQRHGFPRTLAEMMRQEGRAAAFAGMEEPSLVPAELDRVRETIAPHRDSRHFPTAFACLYGDAAAESVGYDPLGLPAHAGYALALAEARAL